MPQVLVNNETLVNIADAIREKTKSTQTYYPSAMSEAIKNIQTEGADLPSSVFDIRLDGSYRFYGDGWNWFIDMFGDKINVVIGGSTEEGKGYTGNGISMFEKNPLRKIPFDININTVYSNIDLSSMFKNSGIESVPKINIVKYPEHQLATNISSTEGLFEGCDYLKEVNSEDIKINFSYMNGTTFSSFSNFFYGCYRLRKIDSEFLKNLYSKASYSNSIYYYGLKNCYVLNELVKLPVQQAKFTSNAFANFSGLYRVKDIIFDTQEDGSPYKVDWSKQALKIEVATGYGPTSFNFNQYGDDLIIVTNQEEYEQYKNTDNWCSTDQNYSRYNHDSAVRTINSLPDVSGGSSNTLTLLQGSGKNTDGGQVGNLTEEEIAVATSKGWTITFVV